MIPALGLSTRKQLSQALARYYPQESADFLEHLPEHPASRHYVQGVSRQALHARAKRLLPAAVACTIMAASEDENFIEHIFSKDIAALHPYSALAYAKFEALLLSGECGNLAGWLKIWRHSADVLMAACGKSACGLEEALVVHAAISYMFGCVLTLGEGIKRLWMHTVACARKNRAWKSPYVRMNLSLLGTFVGCSDPYVEWLSCQHNQKLDVADLLLFVRRDFGPECHELIRKIVCSRPPALADCLYSKNPASTINFAMQYVRTCLRRKTHFHSPGLVLAVPMWANDIVELMRDSAVQRKVGPRVLDRLRTGVGKMVRTMRMEKNRFSRLLDTFPTDAGCRLAEKLWNKLFALGQP